jgi:hypothetical protein
MSIMLDDKECADLEAHGHKLRGVWMLAKKRRLNDGELRMLMEAAEAIDKAINPDVDYEDH